MTFADICGQNYRRNIPRGVFRKTLLCKHLQEILRRRTLRKAALRTFPDIIRTWHPAIFPDQYQSQEFIQKGLRTRNPQLD